MHTAPGYTYQECPLHHCHNSQNLKTTQMLTNSSMDKYIWYTHVAEYYTAMKIRALQLHTTI